MKFRLGSHNLPIETGRWKGLIREDRMCEECHVIGDEKHFLFDCQLVKRNDLTLSNDFNDLWKQKDIISLFKRLKKEDLV